MQGDFYIAVNNGSLNGVIPSTAHPVTAKSAIAFEMSAYTDSRKVIIRNARDGISCDAPAWNEEISGIGMAGD
ncbi:hypothetical protein OU995_09755 [Roseateles sp. SL47]|uniref:hypothetical protein n=1 Tax=Roseateles sp. SL47 TaxID=2995138 RepID=UPI00226EAD51|nr:hypothetical protein [Roseateles sp. SL47]WAC74953.1 hypothetical protein OU995_09755 [Roseateles sp. SL47]